MAASCIPAIIGTALMHTLPASNQWGRVVCVWIIYTNSASLAVSFAVISGNFAGFAKTTITLVLFAGYCMGNIAAPQFFISEESKEGYPTAIKTMLACFCISFVLPLVLRGLYIVENRRRDSLLASGEDLSPETEEDGADWQRKSFRCL